MEIVYRLVNNKFSPSEEDYLKVEMEGCKTIFISKKLIEKEMLKNIIKYKE